MFTIPVIFLTTGSFPLSTWNNSFNLIWENRPKAETNRKNNTEMCFKGTTSVEKKALQGKNQIIAQHIPCCPKHINGTAIVLYSHSHVTWDFKKIYNDNNSKKKFEIKSTQSWVI